MIVAYNPSSDQLPREGGVNHTAMQKDSAPEET